MSAPFTQPINVFDYEVVARTRMPPPAWDYFASGATDEVTLRANRAAFDRIEIRARVLVDVSACDLTTTVLGTQVSMPVLVAPMAYQGLAHPEGELATARGAGETGTLMVVSTQSIHPLEDVARAASGPLWFQLYVYKDRQISEALVRRAEEAGCRALVLTVDTPRSGKREPDFRHQFTLPPHLRLGNFVDVGLADMPVGVAGSAIAAYTTLFDATLTWEALDWLRSVSRLPVIVKGVLTGEDAERAAEHGAAGIIVSNHGGRQLDSVPPTIKMLPEVVQAVAGRCEVYVDGGIRRGTDVFKALALGARAVLVGRPVLWGLAARGSEGVEHVLAILREELEVTMALAGRPTLACIDAKAVQRAD